MLISLAATWLLPVQQAKGMPCMIQGTIHWHVTDNHTVLRAMHAPWTTTLCFGCIHAHLHAGFAGWDGESAALGSCALGEAGDDCRRNVLMYVPTMDALTLLLCLSIACVDCTPCIATFGNNQDAAVDFTVHGMLLQARQH